MTSIPMDWLLEDENPSARYLALRFLLHRPADDPDASTARAAIPAWGPARAILDAQWPEGYWMRPGIGYSPKHKATVWQVIFMGALGAPRIEAIDRACAYVLDHSRLADGRFVADKTGRDDVACLNGNLLRAFFQLGCDDARLRESLEALAGIVLRDRFCCRYNAGKSRPARMRDGLPCAWGAVKALAALALAPAAWRSPAVGEAAGLAIDLLLGDTAPPACDAEAQAALGSPLVTAKYPTATRPSPRWRRFGFPPSYYADQLEAVTALQDAARAGLGPPGLAADPRLDAACQIVRARQDDQGRWVLEQTPHNTWAEFGAVGQPNKWITIAALRALQGQPPVVVLDRNQK